MQIRLMTSRHRSLLRALAIAVVACLPSVPHMAIAQAPTSFDADFDRGDRESRAVLANFRCARATSFARAQGLFGPPDSLGHSGHCVVVAARFVSVFLDVDSASGRVTRFSAVDLASRTRYTAPVDTTAMLAMERAELDAQRRGYDAYVKAKRPYSPFTIRFDGDSIEVWMVPASSIMGPTSLGGERGYVYSPDGRTLARTVDRFADYRTFTVPDTGTVQIESRDAQVPTLTEFLLANMLHTAGRNIGINTPHVRSMLPAQPTAPWVRLTHD